MGRQVRLFLHKPIGALVCSYMVVVLVFLSILNPVNAHSSDGSVSWSDGPVVRLSESFDEGWSHDATCATSQVLVDIDRWATLKSACVFGESGGVRLARYSGHSSSYLYAVNFLTDEKFYPIYDFCTGVARCIYSQSEDSLLYTFAAQGGFNTTLVSNFSKNLTRHRDIEGVFYRFNYEDGKKIGLPLTPFRTNAIGISKSGRWAVVELRDYGFIRVDMRTFEYKRVVASGSPYGYGSDPTYELSISDSGKFLVKAGWNGGLDLYEVDGACGDWLDVGVTSQLSTYASSCVRVPLWSAAYLSILSAHMPRFLSGEARLSLRVAVRNNPMRHVVLTPASHASVFKPTLPFYIALGDSFTSGEGEYEDKFYQPLTNTADNKCHVSVRSYPYLVGGAWGVKTENRSCSGSRLSDIKAASGLVITQSKSMGMPTVLSLSVGGNDVNLMGKLKTCLGVGTCNWAKPENLIQTAAEIKSYFGQISAVILELRADYPEAALAVIGYPSVVNAELASCAAPVGWLLNGQERKYLDESVRYLNKVLKAAANYAKVKFIDIESAFMGERLCDSSDKAMNGVRLGDDISVIGSIKVVGAESFHPTPKGHQLVASVITSQAGVPWEIDSCSGCQYTEGQLDYPAHWTSAEAVGHNEGSDEPKRLIAGNFLSTKTLRALSTVPFSFKPGSFLPGSLINFELHSEPQPLSTHTVNEDGSASGEIIIPKLSGYHSVHAYGLSYSEDPVDVYEIVSIEDISEASGIAGGSPGTEASAHQLGNQRAYANSGSQSGDADVLGLTASLPVGKNTTDAPTTLLGSAPKPTKAVLNGSSDRVQIGLLAWFWLNALTSLLIVVALAVYTVRRWFNSSDANKRLDGL